MTPRARTPLTAACRQLPPAALKDRRLTHERGRPGLSRPRGAAREGACGGADSMITLRWRRGHTRRVARAEERVFSIAPRLVLIRHRRKERPAPWSRPTGVVR